jgi:hypothetical protein
VHDCVLSEEDDLPGRGDEDLALVLLTGRRLNLGQPDPLEAAGTLSSPVVVVGVGGCVGGRAAGDDGARGKERAFQVVDQVVDVLDADAKADQVLGQAALGAEMGRN